MTDVYLCYELQSTTTALMTLAPAWVCGHRYRQLLCKLHQWCCHAGITLGLLLIFPFFAAFAFYWYKNRNDLHFSSRYAIVECVSFGRRNFYPARGFVAGMNRRRSGKLSAEAGLPPQKKAPFEERVTILTKYIVQGGHPLFGEVEISGAKNAAVAILPAALLVDGTCRIENIPRFLM